MIINSYDAHNYCQVFLIIQMKNGAVFKTKPIGFCHKDRPKKENELYSSLSTSLTKNPTFEIELMG